VGVPLVVISLPLVFFILTRLVYPIRLNRLPGGRELILQEMRELGPMRGPETTVATVFVLVAALWISRPLVSRVVPGLSDAGIAISGALLLFVLPVNLRRGIFVLNWEWARRLPWDVLILFGGGLSLAAAANDTGLAAWIGRSTSSIGHWPILFIIAAVTLVIVLLTELTSNTATAATFLPIVASVASGLGRNPLVLVVPAALGASCAFMLPVATPPNAIIYGSGRVSVPQMVRAGVWLNLLFLVLITLFAYLLVPTLFTPPGSPLSP
jgi:sodium-dependent dicarboxylate transporter 2/3/5